mgnify:CR=1 FL=1
MNLKNYIKKLKKLEKKHGDLIIIYSIDDEGNEFHPVIYNPGAGKYDIESGEYYNSIKNCNAICIN